MGWVGVVEIKIIPHQRQGGDGSHPEGGGGGVDSFEVVLTWDAAILKGWQQISTQLTRGAGGGGGHNNLGLDSIKGEEHSAFLTNYFPMFSSPSP